MKKSGMHRGIGKDYPGSPGMAKYRAKRKAKNKIQKQSRKENR